MIRAATLLYGRGSAPAWNPSQLFLAGERGAWWDVSDLSSMFQDAAGTTAITATGQSVGLLRDKSGNGNHLTQSGTARPVLQQDASGNYYLNFNGSTQFLKTTSANNLYLDASKVLAVCGALIGDYTSTVRTLWSRTNDSYPPGLLGVYRYASIGLETFLCNAAATGLQLDIASSSTTSAVVHSLRINPPVDFESYLNSVDPGGAGSMGGANAGLGASDAYVFRLGAWGVDNSSMRAPLLGRIYGMVLRMTSTWDDSLRVLAERWVGSKCGVVI